VAAPSLAVASASTRASASASIACLSPSILCCISYIQRINPMNLIIHHIVNPVYIKQYLRQTPSPPPSNPTCK